MLNQSYEQTDRNYGKPPFCVLLAYPDSAHERLARSFWASFTQHFCDLESISVSHFCDLETISVSAWKFEMLVGSALHAISASEARQARLVLIATDGAGALPDRVKGWFANWCTLQLGVRGVVVFLLTGHSGHFVSDWADYSYFATKTMEGGRQLIVYTTGWSPIENGGFHLPEARIMTPTGLVVTDNFIEIVNLVQLRSSI